MKLVLEVGGYYWRKTYTFCILWGFSKQNFKFLKCRKFCGETQTFFSDKNFGVTDSELICCIFDQ